MVSLYLQVVVVLMLESLDTAITPPLAGLGTGARVPFSVHIGQHDTALLAHRPLALNLVLFLYEQGRDGFEQGFDACVPSAYV
jgi:hypothetical protein